MDGQVIGCGENIVLCLDDSHRRIQTQCCADGQERVSADDLHAQCNGCVGNQCADGTQTDDAQCLAFDLRTGELALALFHLLCNGGFTVGQTSRPGHCLRNLSGGDEQTGEHQFLYGIGIGTRCVEYTDAGFCAAIQRDVVDTGTCTGDCQQVGAKFGFVQRCAAHQNGIRILSGVGYGVILSEPFGSGRRNLIECLNGIHGIPSFLQAFSVSN